MFKVLGVDHIGIAVGDLKEVGSFWGDMLGLPNNGEETVEEQKIAKFIEKNGGRGGIQHIALRVDNLEAALADLKEKGVRLIDEKPRKGAGGAKIAFVHPKASHGVLLELCQRD